VAMVQITTFLAAHQHKKYIVEVFITAVMLSVLAQDVVSY
jgi:hypothetical protein